MAPPNQASEGFLYSFEQLQQMNEDVLNHARLCGASAADSEISLGIGQNVSVRQQAVETIEYNRDKGLSVSVYFGQRRGNASTSDLSPQAIRDTVARACDIARYTAEDAFCGLADASLMAYDYPDLDLYHPWQIDVPAAIALASQCEQAAFDSDNRIGNSEGATVATSQGLFCYANTHGFFGGYPTTRHAISCSVIAQQQEQMQRDYWYSTARNPTALLQADTIGKIAAMRALRRLDVKKIKTAQVPVVFEAPLAAGLISSLISAVSGGNLYRKTSFLPDSLGKAVAAPLLNIIEDAYIPQALTSAPFDGEGVRTQRRPLVENGVLQGYVLSSYSARKLGLQTTGNAGGNHNLIVAPTFNGGLDALLKEMGNGLLVTELLGHGLNMVTGDYSRGASGFWVQNGQIQHAVEEITIAGNMVEMLQDIQAIGDDILIQGSKQVGSILLKKMTVGSDG